MHRSLLQGLCSHIIVTSDNSCVKGSYFYWDYGVEGEGAGEGLTLVQVIFENQGLQGWGVCPIGGPTHVQNAYTYRHWAVLSTNNCAWDKAGAHHDKVSIWIKPLLHFDRRTGGSELQYAAGPYEQLISLIRSLAFSGQLLIMITLSLNSECL